MFTDDNKGQTASTGWAVIFFLLILVPIAVIFIIFNQVMSEYLVPISGSMVMNTTSLNASARTAMITEMTRYDLIWYALPIVIIIALVLWLIINAMKRRNGEY